ncbi:DNA-binding protein [Altererythrobacter sp. FM1]|nr:DNA-binding protein [Altererythrobacter sp. FM1]
MDNSRLSTQRIQFITVEEFAAIARVSRRTIDRYRRARPDGFPAEYDLGRGLVPRPRFKLEEVERWLDSRALW